jgi:hypothetical protein
MKPVKILFIALLGLASLNLAACESLTGFGSSDRGQGGLRGGGLFRF